MRQYTDSTDTIRPGVGLLLVVGVLGSVVGCGSPSQQVALDKEDENGMLAERQGIRKYHRHSNYTAVLADLQTCQTAFANPNPNDN
jgi:hypothetical protein